ncbi:MAG: ORF6N domain-containing protein [Ruminococcus sp.]|nr:ORF6N domain-containing protein [Ruminococcus sp.]
MTELKLTPIENEGKRVLTTAQLAEAYGTNVDTINRNFNRNKSRYTEGKHFYRLTGAELKEFFASDKLTDTNSSKIRTLYLWTEKGALLHAKSLNTDKAWEVYDFLVDTYFRVQAISNSYTELLDLLRNDITSDIDKYIDSVLDERIETIVSKVIDEKIKIINENTDRKADSIIKAVQESIIETLFTTAQSLIPCFMYTHKKLKRLLY